MQLKITPLLSRTQVNLTVIIILDPLHPTSPFFVAAACVKHSLNAVMGCRGVRSSVLLGECTSLLYLLLK